VVAHAIGLNAFELWRKLGADFYREWHTWAKEMLIVGNPHPLALVSWSGVIVSLNSSSKHPNEGILLAEMAMLSLWARSTDDRNQATSLAIALDEIASFFALSNPEFPNRNVKNARTWWERVFALFERLLPRFAISPDSSLRSSVAEVLYRVSCRRPLPAVLSAVIAKLAQDNRARVRIRLDSSKTGSQFVSDTRQ